MEITAHAPSAHRVRAVLSNRIALLAADLREQPQSPQRNARLGWLAEGTFRTLVGQGRLTEAAVMLGEIRTAGEALAASSSPTNQRIGKRMIRLALEPFRGRGFLAHMRGNGLDGYKLDESVLI